MSASHVLRHLHLHRPPITPFARAQNLQSAVVSQFLAHKAAVSSATPPSPRPAPLPTLLTFTPTPVYTTGRRELGALSPSQIASLQEPLWDPPHDRDPALSVAEVHETPRGGQITFHGPGQLVIYPVLDLKALRGPVWPRGLTARCYVNLLEETTIRTLSRFRVRGRRTDHPGVWVDEDTKIAALGVHLRRNVTAYGVGLNVSTDLRWFDRIVACGLEGKRTTSMKVQAERQKADKLLMMDLTPRKVAIVWASEFAAGLWGEEGGVEQVEDEE